MGLTWRSLVTPCFSFFSFFFSLSFFFRLISWSIEAPCVHLSARVSKTWTGRRSASSLPQETEKAPVASVNRANFLSRSFIGFLCKPKNISLFLSSIFLSTTFFPYLSLNQSPTLFLLRVSLDPAGGWTPAVRIPGFHYHGPGSISGQRTKNLQVTQPKKHQISK